MAKILIGRKLSDTTDSVTAVQGDAGSQAWPVREVSGLVPKEYDHVLLTYDSPPNENDIVQVTYKVGGSGGTTVAVLSITYDANRNISSVTRA